MLHCALWPTFVSPPGLLQNFTRFCKVRIGKILSHTRKTSYNNLPDLVLDFNLSNPINCHFGSISAEQRARVRPVGRIPGRISTTPAILRWWRTVSWFQSLLAHSIAFCPSEAGGAGQPTAFG